MKTREVRGREGETAEEMLRCTNEESERERVRHMVRNADSWGSRDKSV